MSIWRYSTRLLAVRNFRRTLSQHRILKLLGREFLTDETTNVTDSIVKLTERKLLDVKYHPLNVLKERIINVFEYLKRNEMFGDFEVYDYLDPIVTPQQNFDNLLIPEDHLSRKTGENYVINKDFMLRAHTSAHQVQIMSSGVDRFLVFGDVYRRDDIDVSHYPVFHQMEAVHLFPCETYENASPDLVHKRNLTKVLRNLKDVVENLFQTLVAENINSRWVDAYFPFTNPSFEFEVRVPESAMEQSKRNTNWMEMLGCGIIHPKIITKARGGDDCSVRYIGWALGLGLERLAMHAFQIPDIRYFWSTDPRFMKQFQDKKIDEIITFVPFSKYPKIERDISFWMVEDKFDFKSFCEVIRSSGNNWVEDVQLIDEYTDPRTGRFSKCYRLTYRALDKTLTDREVNLVHEKTVKQLAATFSITVR